MLLGEENCCWVKSTVAGSRDVLLVTSIVAESRVLLLGQEKIGLVKRRVAGQEKKCCFVKRSDWVKRKVDVSGEVTGSREE